MIADALRQVGRKGVVTIEKGKSTENSLQIVEGMQFDRGYLSPYFVTDRQKMTVEFHNCKVGIVGLHSLTYPPTKSLQGVKFSGCSYFWLTKKSQTQRRCLQYWTVQLKRSIPL